VEEVTPAARPKRSLPVPVNVDASNGRDQAEAKDEKETLQKNNLIAD
jgi:hypothetical protein